MRTKLFILLCIFITTGISTQAQEVTGFWEIKKVEMEDQSMTPVAKWTRINEDGTYQSGNGWLQNSVGTWSYDKTAKLFSPVETNGIIDNYGPFTVSFEEGTMFWKRMEDGMEVTVTLGSIQEMPKSNADKLSGLWDLQSAADAGKDITGEYDPDNKYYLFIRWDRIYIERTSNGERASGYWHINAHRPEITLMSHSGDKKSESWTVDINPNNRLLTFKGISDSNNTLELTFARIHQFPK